VTSDSKAGKPEASAPGAGPYDLANAGREALAQLPLLLRAAPRQLGDLISGRHALQIGTRLAVQLRLAKLMGCPVCLGLFPGLGQRAGLSEVAVQSALGGRREGLSVEAHAATRWAEAVLAAGGDPPEVAPGVALDLTVQQREHLNYVVRLERLVHAVGLAFLPHTMIERALV